MAVPAHIRMGKIYIISSTVPRFGNRWYVISHDPKESVDERIGYVILHELYLGEKEFSFQVKHGARVVDLTDAPLKLKPQILDKEEFEPLGEMTSEEINELKKARIIAEQEDDYIDPYFRSK